MIISGFILATFVGLLLGLMGGGGGILTMPILVYFFNINPVLATAYSLFIVGFSSLVGVIKNFRKGLVNLRVGLLLAVPALITVYFMRFFVVPAIPENIVKFGDFSLTKSVAIMLFFTIIMTSAAISMLTKKKRKEEPARSCEKYKYAFIFMEGIVVGVVTSFVGGGGFLIVPVLVLFAKLPMRMAVGTSLFVITVNSFVGFMGDLQIGRSMDWIFLLSFTGLSVLGIFVGSYLSHFVKEQRLKKSFGWFILVIAFVIAVKELFV